MINYRLHHTAEFSRISIQVNTTDVPGRCAPLCEPIEEDALLETDTGNSQSEPNTLPTFRQSMPELFVSSLRRSWVRFNAYARLSPVINKTKKKQKKRQIIHVLNRNWFYLFDYRSTLSPYTHKRRHLLPFHIHQLTPQPASPFFFSIPVLSIQSPDLINKPR